MITRRKKNAWFGRYPSCDMLNNAMRFLLRGNEDDKDHALFEIINAISKADGYVHDDISDRVMAFRKEYIKKYWEEHDGSD